MLVRTICAIIYTALAIFATPAPSLAAESPCPAILDHKFANLMDEPVSLCQFGGKVLLIVNTASEWAIRRSTTAWKNYTAAIATKGSRFWDFQRTILAVRSRGRIKRSRNSAG